MSALDDIIKIADEYYIDCVSIIKLAYIRKLPNGKYRVLSEKGKNLGTYTSKEQAKKRLKQVEYFKYLSEKDKNKTEDAIDLSNVKEFSLSNIMRELNKKASKKQIIEFLEIYKKYFDKCIKNKTKNADEVALKLTFKDFCNSNNVKVNNKFVKVAESKTLGDPVSVGKYLSDIVKFILNKISPGKRQKALDKLKYKFYYLNENEIALKKMPASSAMGQSITFVKTVLFDKDARYIREVLNNLVKFL
jgi:hypothetical protein